MLKAVISLVVINYVCIYTWKHYISLGKTIESIILCIRFPFLYPRNRFTDKHYNYWPLMKWRNSHYDRAYTYTGKDEHFRRVVVSYKWVIIIGFIDFINNYVLPLFHFIPTTNELYAMEPGWRKAFGIKMCKELRKQLIKDKLLFKFRIMQLKEKWGAMELYCNYATDEVYRIIDKYHTMSEDICGVCGKPADYISAGYVYPYCKECFDKTGYISWLKRVNENGEWEDNYEEDLY